MNIKNTSLCMAIALLGLAAGSAEAGEHVRYKCESTAKGKCPPPPVPPAPPAPPAPPSPPHLSADGFVHAAPPAPPAPPALPMPPAPPPIPEVPAAAHAACAGKPDGARITYIPGKGETMTGVCEREDGKPVFHLREYRIHD